MIIKALDSTVEGTTDESILAKISAESIDRDGEVLVPQGMNSSEYERNPILFWNHDYGNPIGNVTKLKRDKTAIHGTLTFAKRPEGTTHEFFPETIESMVRQGFVKGVSVGFVPEDGGVRAATVQDRKQYGSTVKRVYNRWKLLEVSVAPLPANQDALIEAVGKGVLSAVHCKKYFGFNVPEPRTTISLNQPMKRERIVLQAPLRAKKKQINHAAMVQAELARLRGQIYL